MNNDKTNEKELSRYEMLASFLTDDALNNVTLKGSDGVTMPANRFLLAARSPVFRGMFVGKFQEASSSIVELGFPGCVLKAVVEYILTDSPEMLATSKKRNNDDNTIGGGGLDFKDIQLLVSLAEAASYFDLPGLGKLVIDYIKETLDEFPSLSFSLLQACRMTGPSVPDDLVEFAVKSVRECPFEYISSKSVACLTADVLEEILKDTDTGMTEYELFLVLKCWAEANESHSHNGNQDDVQKVAKSLSKLICLEKIDTDNLSTTVTASGLVSDKQLLEAYKQQAMDAKKKVETPRNPQKSKWKTELPDNHGPPSELLVQGAGVDAVNGVYERAGSKIGYPKYTMQGTYRSSPCTFQIYTCGRYWYINIPGITYFYQVRSANTEFPPHDGWDAATGGNPPSPKISYRM